MTYISQLIVLILALTGTFFKGARQDDAGHTLHFEKGPAKGFPKPSTAGFIIVFFLLLSSTISIYSTRQTEKDSQKKNDQAEENQRKLNQQIIELQAAQIETKNKTIEEAEKLLETVTGKLASTQRGILTDFATKHRANLDRFSSLLSFEHKNGKQTYDEIRKAMNPIKDLTIDFDVYLPGKERLQKVDDSHLRLLYPFKSMTFNIWITKKPEVVAEDAKNPKHWLETAAETELWMIAKLDFSKDYLFGTLGSTGTREMEIEAHAYDQFTNVPVEILDSSGEINSWLQLKDVSYLVELNYEFADDVTEQDQRRIQDAGIPIRTMSFKTPYSGKIIISEFQKPFLASLMYYSRPEDRKNAPIYYRNRK